MKTDFSFGPWVENRELELREVRGRGRIAVEISNGYAIGYWVPNEWEGMCPDSKLIAAAPDLFKACEMVVDRWENGDLAGAARACSAAIAKATGQDSV